MASVREWRPLAVVAATDLLLVAVVGSPWVTEWALAVDRPTDGVGRSAVKQLLFPGWGAADAELGTWALAVWWERWRAGVIFRIVAFLLLHLWVVRRIIRSAGPRLAWREARRGAWVFGPVVGALAGLATVIPGAFDLSTSLEDRAVLRRVVVMSLRDGAYWGFAAGAVCSVVLAASSLLLARGPRDVRTADAAEPGKQRPHVGMAPRLLVSASGLLAAAAVVAALGGPAIARAGVSAAGASAVNDLAVLVSHFRWWVPDQVGDATRAFASARVAAIPVYLGAMFVLLFVSRPSVLAGSRAYRVFAQGWHATTWAAILAAAITGLLVTRLRFAYAPFAPRGALFGSLAGDVLSELHGAVVYTALLGWVPALAVLATARLLPRVLSMPPRTGPEDAETGRSEHSTG